MCLRCSLAACVAFVNPAVIGDCTSFTALASMTLCLCHSADICVSECQAEQDVAVTTETVSSFMQHSPVGRRQGVKRAASPSNPGPDGDTGKKRARVINVEAHAGRTADAAAEVQPFISHSTAEGSRRRVQASEEVVQDGQGVSAGDVVSAEHMAAQALLGLQTLVDRQGVNEWWGLFIAMQPM